MNIPRRQKAPWSPTDCRSLYQPTSPRSCINSTLALRTEGPRVREGPGESQTDRLLVETTEMTDMMSTTPSPQPELNRDRLPTLFEVLSRRTLPPVDLFSFYIYMRDQQRSVDYLDFWYGRLRRFWQGLD